LGSVVLKLIALARKKQEYQNAYEVKCLSHRMPFVCA
jgi:hypothetical protein